MFLASFAGTFSKSGTEQDRQDPGLLSIKEAVRGPIETFGWIIPANLFGKPLYIYKDIRTQDEIGSYRWFRKPEKSF